jgi:hypothetical protein
LQLFRKVLQYSLTKSNIPEAEEELNDKQESCEAHFFGSWKNMASVKGMVNGNFPPK